MKRTWVAALVSALALGLLAAPATAGDQPRLDVEPGYGVIQGTVSNPGFDQEVLAERIGQPGWRYRTSVRDHDYTLAVKAGEYRVTFLSNDNAWEYFPGTRTLTSSTVVRVKDQRTTTGIDADLDPSGTISGTVTFPTGVNPQYSNATVSAYYLDAGRWRPVPSRSASETRWPFTVRGLPSGTYRLYYSTNAFGGTASGFLGGTDDAAAGTPVIVTAGQDTRADITPRLGGKLTGRVVDPDGSPVAGADVEAVKKTDDPDWVWFPWSSSVDTDADGRYTISGLDTGDYYLIIRPPEPFQNSFSGSTLFDFTRRYASSWDPPDGAATVHATAAATTTWADETVVPAGSLAGTVRDGDGNPVEGITVELRPGSGYVMHDAMNWDAAPIRRTTDADGDYLFDSLAYGPYKVRFLDPDGGFQDFYYYNQEWWDEHGTPDYGNAIFLTPGIRHVIDAQLQSTSPSISDTSPVVGQELRARYGSGGSEAWTWKRDGSVIPGATGPTYRATTSDRGARLSVQTTSTRNGSPVRHVRTTSAVSASRPAVTLSTQALGRGKVRLTIKATAPGVARSLLDGKIDLDRVRSGSDHVAVRTMRDGSLVLALTGQPRGRQTYKVRFLAVKNRYSTSATASRALTVR